MFLYDILAIMLIGISHVLFYLQLIRYNRFSYTMIITLSIVFTILLGIIISITGYPELNIIMLLLFLLSLGLMQVDLTFRKNLYFTLVSMVCITLIKMVFMEIGVHLFMWSPFNLYLWTGSLIHLIVSMVLVVSVWMLRKQIRQLAEFIIESRLYYISYLLFAIGLIIILILTTPSTPFLARLYLQYGEMSYTGAFILFFILFLIVLVGAHLTKERILVEQQEHLDKELLDYVEKLELLHDELASFRHDYVNVLLSLDQGVRAKDLQQIEQIYYDVIAPTTKMMNNRELDIVKLSKITIPEVKSILSVKLIAAQQQNIEVMIDIPQTIKVIGMPTVSFIRAISIVVDNAIEEAADSEEKIIQLAFFEMNQHQYFIVRNRTKRSNVNLQKIYEKNYSCKEENRGYGLYSLKRIIDKTANATLETSFKDFYFTQTLIIKKQ